MDDFVFDCIFDLIPFNLGTSSLREAIKFSDSHERKEPMKLVDETDMLRYAGPTALIIHSQTTEDLKFRLSLEKMHSKVPYELRWRQVAHHLMTMKRLLKRNQELSEGIMNLAQYLKREATHMGNTTVYRRVDFICVLEKHNYFKHTPAKQISLIFTLFDPFKTDKVRFADFIAALTVLDKPSDSAIDKFSSVWRIYETFGNDMSIMDMALQVLTCCADSDDDVLKVEKEFKTTFRQCCYISSIELDPKIDLQLRQKAAIEQGERSERVKTTSRSQRSGAAPAYSICDTVLDVHLFRTVLQKCPTTLQLIDDQLSLRLVNCYGKDPRRLDLLATSVEN